MSFVFVVVVVFVATVSFMVLAAKRQEYIHEKKERKNSQMSVSHNAEKFAKKGPKDQYTQFLKKH